jgi:hypothetical protein
MVSTMAVAKVEARASSSVRSAFVMSGAS